MFLRRGKNKGDEGSLFQCLLAMAAAATTAMFFSPISEISWQFGFVLMGAAAALAGAASSRLSRCAGLDEHRSAVSETQDPVWASGSADRSLSRCIV